MRLLLIPDSFKGSLSQEQACDALYKAILDSKKDIEATLCPIADGGEGTLSCFKKYFGYKGVNVKIHNHLNEEIISEYAYFHDTVVIEVAKACGITLCKELNPYKATSFGVGELIKASLNKNPKRIILTLGGSATNDLGLGMALSLGAKFYSNDKEIIPNILKLNEITKINLDEVFSLLKNIEVIGISDVKNPLCGKFGATAIFGPQKGVKASDIKAIDKGFLHICNLIKEEYKLDNINKEGAGAAGGLGYATLSFLNGVLKPGIDTILDMLDIDKLIKESDYIVTGEGSFDYQSLNGKVIDGLIKRCKKFNKRLIILCGIKKIDYTDDSIYMIEEIKRDNENIKESIKNAYNNLYRKMLEVLDRL